MSLNLSVGSRYRTAGIPEPTAMKSVSARGSGSRPHHDGATGSRTNTMRVYVVLRPTLEFVTFAPMF